MKRTELMRLDFGDHRPTWSIAGFILCVLGAAACLAVALAFNSALNQRGRLDGELETVSAHKPRLSDSPARAAEAAEFDKMSRQLSVPWTTLLSELESASKDMENNVSLLQVEPDAEKHLVRITAEVRSLPDALAYLKRLQQSQTLRYPMLESHERIKDDPEHAIRVKLSAEWRA
ncbi:MAG TPA: hypothetical protein VGI93_16160 [Steroidobacteraceae bacterium]|jgi:hypothetical protein